MDLVQERTTTHYDPVELMDDLLSYKIDSTTFIENEKLVKILCDAIDNLIKKEQSGYFLMSISVRQKSTLKLVTKRSSQFIIHSWTMNEKIEKPINITIHEEGDEDIIDWAQNTSNTNGVRYDADLITLLISESLTGYCINKKNLIEHIEFLKQDRKEFTGDDSPRFKETTDIYEFFRNRLIEKAKDIRDMVTSYAQRLNCDKLEITVDVPGIKLDPWFGVAKIVKVRQRGNSRLFQMECHRIADGKINGCIVIGNRNAGVKSDSLNLRPIGNLAIAEVRNCYGFDGTRALERIPYEFVDEGRTLVIINRGDYWNIIVGPDPRSSTEDPVANIKRILEQYVDTVLQRTAEVNARIFDKDKCYVLAQYERIVQKEQIDIKPLQLKLKALKRMIEEYQYIVKKEKAKGKDVTITDKVKYNHERGEVQYNDFSFAVDDEMIKNSFMSDFDNYVVKYFRGTQTEEEILNDILDNIFYAISRRLNTYSSESTTINIRMNNAVNIKLEIKESKGGARLIYINGQRFNKNEVVTVLKEMTCYRSQDEADMFIRNIGKIGLSVYIAISTGYEVEFRNRFNKEEAIKRIFRFRKHKGRSNYSLILDTVEIPITGKVLINTLYSKFIGEQVPDFDKKIPKLIMSSVSSSLDYAKYKFLIDSTYESFQKNSMDFLTKKVADVGGKFCKYFNRKNNKIMDAIEVTGLSGKKYVITYDKTNSWVFLNPEVDEGGNYKDGKYVCMIDQSNIKSNIGYDTVIAKLLALRNDSVIANRIYNLKEELDD